jgi:hypothetical protein
MIYSAAREPTARFEGLRRPVPPSSKQRFVANRQRVGPQPSPGRNRALVILGRMPGGGRARREGVAADEQVALVAAQLLVEEALRDAERAEDPRLGQRVECASDALEMVEVDSAVFGDDGHFWVIGDPPGDSVVERRQSGSFGGWVTRRPPRLRRQLQSRAEGVRRVTRRCESESASSITPCRRAFGRACGVPE